MSVASTGLHVKMSIPDCQLILFALDGSVYNAFSCKIWYTESSVLDLLENRQLAGQTRQHPSLRQILINALLANLLVLLALFTQRT
jgi:formate/nitrite transporter FocA (FNT family)